MKTLAFESAFGADHKLTVPEELASQIPASENVRVIILLPEDRDWQGLTEEQFLAGYGDTDGIYDAL